MPLEKLSEKVRGKQDHVGGDLTEGAEPGVTDTMPVVPHKVIYSGIPFYTDREGKNEVADGKIVVLLPLDPDGFQMLDAVPSRKNYQPGQYLNWQLNKDKLWEECYYRNPETGQIEQAWTMHVEFVGKVLSEKAIAADRERLDKMEASYGSAKGEVSRPN